MIDYLIMKVKVLAIFFIVALFAAGAFFYWFKAKPENVTQPSCPDCNVVVIAVDPLRVSNMSLYGYKKETTPFLDKLAEKGIVFTNAISVSSWTLPSAMSLLTGVYPSQHRLLNKITVSQDGKEEISDLRKLSPELKTIAEELNQAGYKTGGFTGGAALDSQFGFDKGFDVYTSEEDFGGLEKSIPKAINWIGENKGSKLFVFVQGYDTHGQYVPEGGYDKRFVDFDYKGKLTGGKDEQKELREEGILRGQIFLTKEDVSFLQALYDEKLQRADSQIAPFFKQYADLGLSDKTVFVVISNHGEELYEHGRVDHGYSLYEELVKIPLIILPPDLDRQIKINSQVANIDIAPTIFKILGLQMPEGFRDQMEGKSVFDSQSRADDIFLETDYRYATFKRGVRTADGWKYIVDLETGEEELYNVKVDPGESENLIDKEPARSLQLEQELGEHFDKE